MKVFLSHSSQDSWVARQVARAIRECGCEVFLDEANVEIGGSFAEDIRSFLQEADELVLLATPAALTRPYVWIEVGAAWSRRIRIVTLVHQMSIAEFVARDEVPGFLRQLLAVRLDDLDQYLAELRWRMDDDKE